MPSVTTLPSATAGEERGPENPEAGPLAPRESYLSFHNSFPLAASRQRVVSAPSARANTYSLSPTTAGVATPSPTVTFQVVSLGHVFGASNPDALPSRPGPRHW